MPNIQQLEASPSFAGGFGKTFAKSLQQAREMALEMKQLEAYRNSVFGGEAPTDNEEPRAVESLAPETETAQPVAMAGEQTRAETAPVKSKVQPILASRQLPPPVRAKDIPQHATAVQTARARGDALSKDYRKVISGDAEKARKTMSVLNRAEQLAKTSKNVEGFRGWLQSTVADKYGLPFLKSADVKELQRIGKEVVADRFREQFGARPAASEFFYIENVYFKPGDPKESLTRSINLEKQINKLALKRQEISNDVFAQYGEYPLNFEAIVEDKMTPYYRNMMKNIGYDKWEGKHKDKAERINTGKVEAGTKLEADEAKLLLQQADGNKEEARRLAKELGYSF